MHDSFAPSNIDLLSHGAGHLADQAACQKLDRYKELMIMTSHFFFVPLVIESTGVFGEPLSGTGVGELGHTPLVR